MDQALQPYCPDHFATIIGMDQTLQSIINGTDNLTPVPTEQEIFGPWQELPSSHHQVAPALNGVLVHAEDELL